MDVYAMTHANCKVESLDPLTQCINAICNRMLHPNSQTCIFSRYSKQAIRKLCVLPVDTLVQNIRKTHLVSQIAFTVLPDPLTV